MPWPEQNESEKTFIARFLSDLESRRDYPDIKQRLAVAYSLWRNRDKSSSSSSSGQPQSGSPIPDGNDQVDKDIKHPQ